MANPWIFRQLSNWLHTGQPGGRGEYGERLDLMETHFRRMVAWRGEYPACLQFRKVAPYHCRALAAGPEIHNRLQMLADLETFEDVLEILRERGQPESWSAVGYEAEMRIPTGAISHW